MPTDDMKNCLECDNKLFIYEFESKFKPKKGKEVICPHCGAVHVIELSWTLKSTGKFDKS